MTQEEIKKKIESYPHVLEIISDDVESTTGNYEKHRLTVAVKVGNDGKSITNCYYLLDLNTKECSFYSYNTLEDTLLDIRTVSEKVLAGYYAGLITNTYPTYCLATVYSLDGDTVKESRILITKDGSIKTII